MHFLIFVSGWWNNLISDRRPWVKASLSPGMKTFRTKSVIGGGKFIGFRKDDDNEFIFDLGHGVTRFLRSFHVQCVW